MIFNQEMGVGEAGFRSCLAAKHSITGIRQDQYQKLDQWLKQRDRKLVTLELQTSIDVVQVGQLNSALQRAGFTIGYDANQTTLHSMCFRGPHGAT